MQLCEGELQREVGGLLDDIISYRGEGGAALIDKFCVDFLVSFFDRTRIDRIEKVYKYKEKGLDIIEFVRFFLNAIDHKDNETLYLAISLIDFFKEISEINSDAPSITFVDITNFLCFRTSLARGSDCVVKTKLLPTEKSIRVSLKVREIETHAPVIFSSNTSGLKKLEKNLAMTDNTRHKRGIKTAHFARESKRVITLDSMSDHLRVYDMNLQQVQVIEPSKRKTNRDIFSFTFSERQQRIGAAMKDYSLSFWDAHDNFKYEMSFLVNGSCQECQEQIYFMEELNMWVTTDKTSAIHVWNIATEDLQQTIVVGSSKVSCVTEVPYLKLLAIGMFRREARKGDKERGKVEPQGMEVIERSEVVLYSLIHKKSVVTIETPNQRAGVHSVLFAKTFQILLVTGFESKINCYQINPQFYDCTLKGKLVSHVSIVTSVVVLEQSPMLVSADDKGSVKLWDLRSLKCIQSLDFGCKMKINKLLNLEGRIAFVGSRLSYVNFCEESETAGQGKEDCFPIRVEASLNQEELLVCTRKDVRFYDMRTGKVKHIFSELFQDGEEIAIFRNVQNSKRFLIGNHKGQIKSYSYLTGEPLGQLCPHQNEVSSVKIDYLNKLFVSSGWDSTILVQKEVNSQFKVVRELNNNFFKREITLMEISIYHNLIAIGSTSENALFLWDYEFGKLLMSLQFDREEPTSLAFLNGLAMIIVCTNQQALYLFAFKNSESLFQINLVHKARLPTAQPNEVNSHMLLDLSILHKRPKSAKVVLGFSKGRLLACELKDQVSEAGVVEHENTRLNYNASRQIKQNFINEVNKQKFKPYLVPAFPEQTLAPCFDIKAHKDCLTSMVFFELENKLIITSSLDMTFKIWTLAGQRLCNCNINRPLPFQWNLKVCVDDKVRKKILFAIKVIQVIFKKYSNDISIGESRCLRLNNFFQLLKKRGDGTFLTAVERHRPAKVNLFKDEFSQEDLNYDFIRKINFKEIGGPTLKEMDVKKRIHCSQKVWAENKIKEQGNYEMRLKALEDYKLKAIKMEERQQIMTFLDPRHKDKYEQDDAMDEDGLPARLQRALRRYQRGRDFRLEDSRQEKKYQAESSERQEELRPSRDYVAYFDRMSRRRKYPVSRDQQKMDFKSVVECLNDNLTEFKKPLSEQEVEKSELYKTLQSQFYSTNKSSSDLPVKPFLRSPSVKLPFRVHYSQKRKQMNEMQRRKFGRQEYF